VAVAALKHEHPVAAASRLLADGSFSGLVPARLELGADLKVHLHESTDQTYVGQIIKLLSVFDIALEFADLFKFVNIQVTQLTPSLIPHQLKQH
jgi:hypothetical protein